MIVAKTLQLLLIVEHYSACLNAFTSILTRELSVILTTDY